MTLSLHARLLLAATLSMAVFLGLTGLVLDKAFRDSAETALRDRLQGNIHALLAAAELDAEDVMRLPDALPEPRFATAGSGLYADVSRIEGSQHWRSRSALGIEIAFPSAPGVGARVFEHITAGDGTLLYALSYGVSWENSRGEQQSYAFRVAEDLEGFHAQISRFRRSLWGWLGAAALLLLAVQGIILRWGLAPLRRVADDLAAIDAGQSQRLTGTYPKELRGLTDNLNALIASAQTHLARYRDSLGNLAHSLKTPLAVLRGAVEEQVGDEELRQAAKEQVARMTQIVDYQLQRAAASGPAILTAPVNVASKAKQVVMALAKVYADKSVQCQLNIDDGAVFYGEESDLLEVLGNLTENAFKWCRKRVEVSARMIPAPDKERPGIEIRVEDDGPGIPEEMAAHVLQRGQRADPSTTGHGIGLAVVQETVRLYGGRLSIDSSPLGGAAIEVHIP